MFLYSPFCHREYSSPENDRYFIGSHFRDYGVRMNEVSLGRECFADKYKTRLAHREGDSHNHATTHPHDFDKSHTDIPEWLVLLDRVVDSELSTIFARMKFSDHHKRCTVTTETFAVSYIAGANRSHDISCRKSLMSLLTFLYN